MKYRKLFIYKDKEQSKTLSRDMLVYAEFVGYWEDNLLHVIKDRYYDRTTPMTIEEANLHFA